MSGTNRGSSSIRERTADFVRGASGPSQAPPSPGARRPSSADVDQFAGTVQPARVDFARPVLVGAGAAVLPALGAGALVIAAGGALVAAFPVVTAVYALGLLLGALGTYLGDRSRARRDACLREAHNFQRRLLGSSEVDLCQALHCFAGKQERFAEAGLADRHRTLSLAGLRAKLRHIEQRRRLPVSHAPAPEQAPAHLTAMDAGRAAAASRLPWRRRAGESHVEAAALALTEDVGGMDAAALRSLACLIEERVGGHGGGPRVVAAYESVLLALYTRRCYLADRGPARTAAAAVDLGALP